MQNLEKLYNGGINNFALRAFIYDFYKAKHQCNFSCQPKSMAALGTAFGLLISVISKCTFQSLLEWNRRKRKNRRQPKRGGVRSGQRSRVEVGVQRKTFQRDSSWLWPFFWSLLRSTPTKKQLTRPLYSQNLHRQSIGLLTVNQAWTQ